MGSVVEIGLANALVAGALAIVAILAGRFSRRPAMAHALWLLVLVKLVTPPLFSLPVPGWEAAAPVAAEESSPEDPQPADVAPTPAPVVPVAVVVPDQPRPMRIQDLIPDANGKLPVAMPVVSKAAPPPPPAEKPVAPPASAPRAARKAAAPPPPAPPSWTGVLDLAGVVWFAGAALWFLVAGGRIFRFHRLLRHARPAPEDLREHAAALARRMGLSRVPTVALVPGPVPPLLWAVGPTPRLFFPRTLLPRLDEAGRSALLVHELAHMARRDHWVRWLELLACGLYWWYPLTWLARRRLHAAEEECCDAWVVSELPGYGAAYAGALLETIDFLSHQPAPLPPAASGIGRVQHLERRMTMIVRGATPRSLSWAGRSLVLALFVALPLTPGPARTAAPPSKDTPTEARKVPQAEGRVAQAVSAVAAEEVPDEPSRYATQPRVLQGSGGAFWACALSPDGKTVAAVAGGLQGSAAGEGTLTLFDLPSGKERACLVAGKPIRCVAYSPDGKTLATGDFDNRVLLRDPATGAVRHTLEGHTSAINSIAFSRDGKTLYSASLDRTIRAWDLSTNKTARTFAGMKDWVLSVAVSGDGKRLVTGSTNQTATVWDATTGAILHTLRGHTHWVEYALFSPDDSQILTCSQDALIKVWDARSGKFVRDLAGHTGAVNAAKFTPDGKKLASVSHDQTVMLWDVPSGRFDARVPSGHAERIYGLDISNDGKTLVTASWDQTVKVWGFPDLTNPKTLQPRRYLPEQNYPILTVACSPDGKTLAVGGEERAVKLIDPATGRLIHLLEGHEDMVPRVAFSPDGKTLASASFDGTAALWDVATGKRLRVLEGHEGWVFSVAFSPDGLLVATGGYDRTVRLWQTRTGKELAKLQKHRGGVHAVAFSRDGRRLASGGADKVIRVWDVLQKEVARSLAGHEDGVRALAFAPDGRRLVSGSEDKTVRLWDIAGGKQIASHTGTDVVRDVAFSPRGQRLASVDQGRMLALLDPSNLNPLLRNLTATDVLTGVAFGPDAQTLYTAGLDRQVREYKAVGEPLRSLVTHGGSGKQMWFALYAPDGKSVALGGGDRAVEVRRAALGKNLGHLTGIDDAAYGVAVSPDGTRLAVGSGDKLIRVYDFASRKLVQTLAGHEFRVWAVAWSPDGQSLASAAGSYEKPDEVGEVKVWDVKSGKERRALAGITASTQALAWSGDGKLLAVGSRDGTCRLYDAASGKTVHALKGHKGSVRSVVFSPESDFLASGDDESVRVWSAADGAEAAKLKGPAGGVNCIAWSNDGGTVAVVGRPVGTNANPGEVDLWRVGQGGDGEPTFGEPVKLKGHANAVLGCAFSPDGKRLLTGGGVYNVRGEVAVWDVTSARLLYRAEGAKLWVEAVAFSKDGKTAVTAGGNAGRPGEVLFWDADAGGWRVAEAHKGEVSCGAYSADGGRLATGGYDGAIKVWDAATGRLRATLAGHEGMVRCIQFSPDGKGIASAGVDMTVKLWDLDATKEPVEITKFGIQATGVSFSPDGKLLAACGGYTNNGNPAGEARVLEIATGKERPGAWTGKGAQAIAFSPDGKQIATGGVGAKALRLYDVQTGKLLREVEGANSVRALAFSRDGKQLASAHGTGGRHGGSSVQIWDTATWQEKAALVEHTRLVLGLGFSPDGKHLITASNDTTVKLWAIRASAKKN